MNEQGTAGWLQDRCGFVTASRFSDVLAKGEGKTRASYLRQVVAERLTGKPTESYSNAHMDRGTMQEPYARLAYESRTGNIVEAAGFIKHPSLMVGGSPDGLIDHDGGIEIKSVIPTVQIETIRAKSYPSSHRAQIQGNMWILNRQWWDFVSYSADMPEKLRLHVVRVKRDDEYIANLEKEIGVFLADIDAMVSELQKLAA